MFGRPKDSPRGSATTSSSRGSRTAGASRFHRTASNASSSSSSEIQVGPPPTASTQTPQMARQATSSSANGISVAASHYDTMSRMGKCRVVGGHLLIIPLRAEQRAKLNLMVSKHRASDESEAEIGNGEDPRNSRGTYPREYTLKHPEIKWVHRGQGRYLPAEEVRKEPAPEPQRRSRYVFESD